jgi:hypothetical protein
MSNMLAVSPSADGSIVLLDQRMDLIYPKVVSKLDTTATAQTFLHLNVNSNGRQDAT